MIHNELAHWNLPEGIYGEWANRALLGEELKVR
jgi:hypothetical protein